MSVVAETDIKQLVLTSEKFDAKIVDQLQKAVSDGSSPFRSLKEALQELELRQDRSAEHKTRLGTCYYLVGRYSLAEQTLGGVDDGLALYYLAKAQQGLGKLDESVATLAKAAKAGYSAGVCALAKADAQRTAGKPMEALATLDSLSGAIEQTAEYLYQRGATVAALGGNAPEVIALFQRAVEVDRFHPGALFGLAMETERRGNDREAVELYKRCVSRFPAHVGALLNLGLLYEDINQFERAQQCYLRILDTYPDHPRARLYAKDAAASANMFYDEEAQKRKDRLGQLLSVPVTDFELSVRSRNCLQKMGIMTLGDLTKTTEQELLASKNFGETSLVEIKEMLSSKKLELGQFAEEPRFELSPFEPQPATPDEQAILSRPVTDLNLSVRARKAMVRLNLQTIADLVRRTADELLECKNFGVTSLNEVREKLSAQGIKLRGD